jgi:F-type H+-transporting ATPase subunit epsilon
MSNFNLNIFTPNGVILKGLKCESFVIPTSNGEINVLPKHMNLISELATGILTAKTSSGDRKFSITAGLLKVVEKEVNVLSTTSEKAEDIDIARAQAAQKKAQSRLRSNEHLTDVDMIKFRRKLERAKMRINLGSQK